MAFAADMAERGNWREASFRWKRLIDQGGPNAKILNNMAVAAEANGEMEQANEYYGQAFELAGGDVEIRENYRRFNRLRELLAERDGDGDRAEFETPIPSNDVKTKGKSVRISVPIPIPPRLDLENFETLLVASFLAEQSTLIDVDREIARFLRGEFRQRTSLEVLDVVPPPAIPEQQLEDLIKNHEFWKHLGR
ncbi:MAG: tetratricopeptide repeat protein, partial [Planctomycetota bacterium]